MYGLIKINVIYEAHHAQCNLYNLFYIKKDNIYS